MDRKPVISHMCVVTSSQAMDYARKLRDDRGRGNIVVVDDGEETEDDMGEDEFQVHMHSPAAYN